MACPALIELLVDAAHEVHGGQGLFEDAGEFPGTTRVDLPISTYADWHKRFGPRSLPSLARRIGADQFAVGCGRLD